MFSKIRNQPEYFAFAVIFFILFARAFTVGMVDLIDPTESRYAFVAQEMVISGDWLTPKLPLPVEVKPYTGKPPLHFWLTAFFMSTFGMDAWVTRVPSLLAFFFIGIATYLFASKLFGQGIAYTGTAITLTSGLLFFLAGTSTIDVTLSAWITGALVAFAFQVHDKKPPASLEGYLLFVFAALAFLTKGPIALILIGMPIFFWLLAKEARTQFPRLPWIGGTALFLLIVAPWFWLHEKANPGSLYYFFVQENFLRFVSKDYGDAFGTGHVAPRGTAIWLTIVGFLPWSPIFLGMILFSREARDLIRSAPLWFRYALYWGVSPMLFFCFARQLHAAYMLPGFTGLGVSLAVLLDRVQLARIPKLFLILTVAMLIFCLGSFPVSFFFPSDSTDTALALLLTCPAFLLIGTARIAPSYQRATLSIALSLAVAYGAFIPLFARHAGLIKSSQEILTFIAQRLPNKDEHVVFFNINAYSFYYYSRAWKDQLGQPISPVYSNMESVLTDLPENLIANGKDVLRFPKEFADRYLKETDFGKWEWWRRKDIAAPIQ